MLPFHGLAHAHILRLERDSRRVVVPSVRPTVERSHPWVQR